MRFSIFSRLFLSHLAIFLLMMLMSLYAISRISQLNERVHSIQSIDNRLIHHIEKLIDNFLSQIRYEKKFIITIDGALYNQFLHLKNDFEKYFNEAVSIVDDFQSRRLFDQASENYQRYQSLFLEEVNYLKNGMSYDKKVYQEEKRKATEGFIKELEQLKLQRQEKIHLKMAGLYESGAHAIKVLLLTTATFLVLGVLTSLVINRSITRPISVMERKTQEIARGIFDGKLNISSPPEIKALANALNSMSLQLKDLDRMKSDFFSSVSHELRTPLTSIQLGTNLLLQESNGPLTEKQKRLLAIVSNESHRLIDLVNSLLDLSKMEAGMMAYDFRLIPLPPLIEKTVHEMELLSEAKKISLTAAVDKNLPLIHADEERFLQLLRNLIGNAIKFTPEGGRVSIVARAIDRGVKVSVVDTGPGISEEHLPHLFDKFHQAPHSHSSSMKGTGLGLALVKHIVTAHRGRIWVESEIGKGSSFIFVLPV